MGKKKPSAVSQGVMAERGGFEPPLPVTVNTLSKCEFSANRSTYWLDKVK